MKKSHVLVLSKILVVGLLVGGVGVGAIMWKIHGSLEEFTAMAQAAHPAPDADIKSLILFLNDDAQSIDDRNHVVWTLGQLSDSEALATLELAYTGEACNHGANLCQYELEKAIKRCGGQPNSVRISSH